MLLDQYKLSLPKISIADWLQAVESASGRIRDVLSAQTKGVRILQSLKETQASTERIGWLNIWAKVFAALESIAAAITHKSKLSLLLCQRNTFELMLQVHTVLDPCRTSNGGKLDGTQSKNNGEYELRSCIERLRAYTAWCLWHDKAYYNELLNPRSMRDIWNYDAYLSMLKIANPPSQMERFLEKVEGRLDEDAFRLAGRRVRNEYNEKIRQIDEWMADSRLRRWRDVIDRASKHNTKGIPFFVLFDRSDASVPKRLLKEGTRFYYSAYVLSSIATHNSSMEEFIQIKDDTIKPLVTGDDGQINQLATELILRCQHIFEILKIINDGMKNNPQIRA
jgi:hypothetical protein